MTLQLTADEQRMLAGAEGDGVALAMRIVTGAMLPEVSVPSQSSSIRGSVRPAESRCGVVATRHRIRTVGSRLSNG